MKLTTRASRRKRLALLATGGMAVTTVIAAPPGSPPVAQAASGPASGYVYVDGNWNGKRDIYGSDPEAGIAGVTVKAFGNDNALIASTVTSSNGAWSLAVQDSARIEVDTSSVPGGLTPATIIAPGSQPPTFVISGQSSGWNIPFVYPASYTGKDVSAPASVPPAGIANGIIAEPEVRIPTAWSDFNPITKGWSGSRGYDGATTGVPDGKPLCTSNEVGSTFGSVYAIGADQKPHYFQGAFTLRHGVLPNPQMIYKDCQKWVELPGAKGDPLVPDTISRTGIGGLALAPDGTAIWAANMSTKEVHRVELSSGAISVTTKVTGPGCDFQIMALTVNNGTGYVGGSCTDSLGYAVYSFNATTGVLNPTPVLNDVLSSTRPDQQWLGYDQACENIWGETPWKIWNNDPTTFTGVLDYTCNGVPSKYVLRQAGHPLLSDIDFDASGRMILAIRDRAGDLMAQGQVDQYPPEPGVVYNGVATGDLILAKPDGNGAWVPETRSDLTSAEYFSDGYAANPANTLRLQNIHAEVANGGLYVSPTNKMMATFIDPIDCSFGTWPGNCDGQASIYNPVPTAIWELGVRRFDPASGGAAKSAFAIVHGETYMDTKRANGCESCPDTGFGKGNGIGDIAALTTTPPLSLGDRVWVDMDRDGIQDPTENGLAGVTVNLTDASGAVVATTTTNADGYYRFYIGGLDSTQYIVKVPNAPGFSGLLVAGAKYGWSPNDTGGDDHSDSDGIIDQSGASAKVSYQSIGSGTFHATNMDYDFGVWPVADLSLKKYVENSDAQNPASEVVINPSVPFVYSIVVRNDNGAPATGVQVTDKFPDGITILSAPGATVTGQNVVWDNVQIAAQPGATVTMNVRVVVHTADFAKVFSSGSVKNIAEITKLDQGDIDSTPGNKVDGEDDQDPAIINGWHDVSVMKFVDPNSVDGNKPADFIENPAVGIVEIGRPFKYRIEVRNDGPSAAVDLTIQDRLPAGIQVLGISNNGVQQSGAIDSMKTIEWPGVNLPAGGSTQLYVDVVIPVDQTATYISNQFRTNVVEVVNDPVPDIDSKPANNLPGEDDIDDVTVKVLFADLELTKSVNGVDNGPDSQGDGKRCQAQDEKTPNANKLPVSFGEEVEWTLSLVNCGPDMATKVKIQDTLPTGFNYVSSTTSNGSYDPATGTWTLVNPVMVGSKIDLTIKAIFLPKQNSNADIERRINYTQVTSANELDPDSKPNNGVTTSEDDGDDAYVDPLNASLGNYVWHDLNGNGTQEAGEPPIADVLVTLVLDQDVIDSAGHVWGHKGDTLTTATASDGSYWFHNLPTGKNGVDYHVEFGTPGGGFLSTQSNIGDDAKDSDPVNGKTEPTKLMPGENDPTWDAGFYLPAKLSMAKTVRGISNVEHDAFPHGENAPINPADPCSKEKGSDPVGGCDIVYIGRDYNYTVTVTNDGPGEARNVVVADAMPDGVTVKSATWTLQVNNKPVQKAACDTVAKCGVPNMPSGSKVTVTYQFTVTVENMSKFITNGTSVAKRNTASVTSTTPDNRTDAERAASNKDTASIEPRLEPMNLTVQKGHEGQDVYIPGSDVVWTIQVTNTGPGFALPGLTVTDTVPIGMTNLKFLNPESGWTCDTNSATCTWNHQLNAGEKTPVIRLSGTIDPTLPGEYNLVNLVVVGPPSGQVETDNSDNSSSSQVVTVKPLPPKTGMNLPFGMTDKSLFGMALASSSALVGLVGVWFIRRRKPGLSS